ncbi:hypothetical protein VCRA2119O147_1570004 [Vibrio crassostreae]|nr:hypothetical protein VCRA2112O187_150063 [Vibrio crassostreae]CAK1946171.1 hypothetical protein VCRA2113O207_290050 [Vibrio crassostreae]CAK1948229.1 hypothetical protein VCRA2118O239_260042 [Vibrio crassostreae]CAK1951899.1 hypothetical protein VCRA2112O184_260013 [Vibrio crassostreae]CAK1955762.1 hypothetical protein VCRA2113O202_270001 [Vibrio crassostreae]
MGLFLNHAHIAQVPMARSMFSILTPEILVKHQQELQLEILMEISYCIDCRALDKGELSRAFVSGKVCSSF